MLHKTCRAVHSVINTSFYTIVKKKEVEYTYNTETEKKTLLEVH